MMPYTQGMSGQMQLPQGMPAGQAPYQPSFAMPTINPGLPSGTSNVMPAMPTGQMGGDRGMPWQQGGGQQDSWQERMRQGQMGGQGQMQPDWRQMAMARQLIGGQGQGVLGQVPMQAMGQGAPMMAGANPAMPWMR